MSHTSGPWGIGTDSDGSVSIHGAGYSDDTPGIHYKLSIKIEKSDNPMADACAIASVPELIIACNKALRRLLDIDEMFDIDSNETVEWLRCALRRVDERSWR